MAISCIVSEKHNMSYAILAPFKWLRIFSRSFLLRDFCLHHLHSTPPFGGGIPSEHCHDVWYVKTRMVWLPDGVKILTIRLLVLKESTNVTDGGVEWRWCRQKSRFWANIWLHGVLWTVLVASAIHLAATDNGELMIVTGKRQSLLMVGDDDEVYDKKPRRYAVTPTTLRNGKYEA